MGKDNLKYYALTKAAEGTDSQGAHFMTVIVELRLKNGGTQPVAWFNEPTCADAHRAGCTWRDSIRTLDWFLGQQKDAILERLRKVGYINIAKRPGHLTIF